MTAKNKTISIDKIIARSVKLLRGNREPWAEKYQGWASRWLSGEDRSPVSAEAVVYTADDAAYAAAAEGAPHEKKN